MTTPVSVKSLTTVEDWQSYLDSKFPAGVQINVVTSDGLSPDAYNIPYMAVLSIIDNWPYLRGFNYGTDYDYSIPVSGWEELDREGHFVAHVPTADGIVLELSSWLSDAAAQAMTAERAEHQQVLGEIVTVVQNDVNRSKKLEED